MGVQQDRQADVGAEQLLFVYADFGYGSNLPDYPKLGQTKDFLLIGANIYLNLVTFLGADIDWITKPQTKKKLSACPDGEHLRAGSADGPLNADGVTLSSTPEPAVQVDPSSTGGSWRSRTAQTPAPPARSWSCTR